MYQMFGSTAKKGLNIDTKIVSATEKEQSGEPKIGSFVQSTFNDLIRQGKLRGGYNALREVSPLNISQRGSEKRHPYL